MDYIGGGWRLGRDQRDDAGPGSWDWVEPGSQDWVRYARRARHGIRPPFNNSSPGQIMFSVEQTSQFSSFMEGVLSFQFLVGKN